MDALGLSSLDRCDLARVPRKLQHRRRLRATRELRVVRLVAPIAEFGRLVDAHEEVRAPAPSFAARRSPGRRSLRPRASRRRLRRGQHRIHPAPAATRSRRPGAPGRAGTPDSAPRADRPSARSAPRAPPACTAASAFRAPPRARASSGAGTRDMPSDRTARAEGNHQKRDTPLHEYRTPAARSLRGIWRGSTSSRSVVRTRWLADDLALWL